MDSQYDPPPSPDPPPQGQGDQPYDPYAPQAPPYPGYDDAMYGAPQLRHSGVGIASMIIGIACVLIGLLAMVITVYFVAQNPDLAEIQGGQDVPPELMAPVLAIGCSICGGGLLSILGLVLGIIGLVQPARLKLFAIIGTVLNGLIVGGGLLLLLVSLATSA